MKMVFVLTIRQDSQDVVKQLELDFLEFLIPGIGETLVFTGVDITGIENSGSSTAIATVVKILNLVDLVASEVSVCILCEAQEILPYGVAFTNAFNRN
ncbi:MAG: hypothetical protein KME28_13135 [Pelatocladus maniniholoensis HA4357-MV3]|jgi:hypothetical protein|uniref:Uncharacterized protein n=1 Tax=Pelatocladus maniniholoensis HA4357-MV3 TaxID=1117104 RepID=A0A9E3LT31_9NOST|nr:hypothetical protein [Pelatocladus maniniholoensis HA4357-MV3]